MIRVRSTKDPWVCVPTGHNHAAVLPDSARRVQRNRSAKAPVPQRHWRHARRYAANITGDTGYFGESPSDKVTTAVVRRPRSFRAAVHAPRAGSAIYVRRPLPRHAVHAALQLCALVAAHCPHAGSASHGS